MLMEVLRAIVCRAQRRTRGWRVVPGGGGAGEVLPRLESWLGASRCGRGVGGEAGRGMTSL